MRSDKVVFSDGRWIVFVIDGFRVVEVHSNGGVAEYDSPRGSCLSLVRLLRRQARENKLFTQREGNGGVRNPDHD